MSVLKVPSFQSHKDAVSLYWEPTAGKQAQVSSFMATSLFFKSHPIQIERGWELVGLEECHSLSAPRFIVPIAYIWALRDHRAETGEKTDSIALT